MKTTTLIAAGLLLALALPAHAAEAPATVTFTVGQIHPAAPADATCTVTVPTGSNGADVLDAAVAIGCIDSWDSVNYGSEQNPDRFVSCINGQCETIGFSWAFYHNDAIAGYGIDGAYLSDGDAIEFRYTSWAVFFLP